MNWYHLRRFSLALGAVVALVAFQNTLYSQIPGLPTPPGESISSGFDGGYATQTQVYTFSDFSVLSGGGGANHQWTAPRGRRINSTGYKPQTKSILILLDNGDVYELPTDGHGKVLQTTYLGKVGSPGSESFDKIVGDAIYVHSSSNVYVTRDLGTTWQVDSINLNGAFIWNIALDTAQHVYAATTNGLFVQNPDSNIWHPVTSLTQATSLYRVFVDRRNRILVGGNGGGLYLSTNNGAGWSVDTSTIGTQSVNLITDDVFGNLYVVTRNVFTNTDHIYKSASGTSPWQQIDGPITVITLNNAAINNISGDSVLEASTSFGLFLSSDQGASWTQRNNGVASEYISGFLKSNFGTWFTGTSLGLWAKNPTNTSWTKSYPINGYSGNVAVTGDGLGNVYAASGRTSAGGPILYKSTDNGTSWNPDTAGVSLLRTGVFFLDEAGGQHLGTSQWGGSFPSLLFTKPLGGSWALDTAGFQSTVYSFSYSIASDKHGYLYVTGSYFNGYGGAQVNARVMRRPIGGGAWVPDTTGLPASVNYLSRLAPDKNGNMMGTAGGSLYRRTSGTWQTVSLPSQAVSNFYSLDKFSVDSSGAIFASFTDFSGGQGVYFTTNGGTSWTFAGLDSLTITQLISYGDSTYVSTLNGLYILQRKAAGATGIANATVTPMTYALFQNYPNPFNPTTAIDFQLAAKSRVTLKVFDILGREVETLIDGEMGTGLHQVTFDASKFASGIYFYRIQAGSFTATKKLILLK